jgi:hypothetical protein
MSDQLHRAGRSRESAQDDPRSSASPNLGNFGLPELSEVIELGGVCGIAFCVGASAALYLENSHFLTTEAIAASQDRPQIVNRSRKGDRLPATMTGHWSDSADVQDGFGTLEVGDSFNTTITVRDAKGRLVLELDPVRRTTVISKREPRGAPSSKEQGRPVAPKSSVVPVEKPSECDRSTSVPPCPTGPHPSLSSRLLAKV